MEGRSAVEKAIFHAIRAGAFSAAARQYPDAAETMRAASEMNHRKAATFLKDFCAGQVEGPARTQP